MDINQTTASFSNVSPFAGTQGQAAQEAAQTDRQKTQRAADDPAAVNSADTRAVSAEESAAPEVRKSEDSAPRTVVRLSEPDAPDDRAQRGGRLDITI